MSARDDALVVIGTSCEGCPPCQERAKRVARAYLGLVADVEPPRPRICNNPDQHIPGCACGSVRPASERKP